MKRTYNEVKEMSQRDESKMKSKRWVKDEIKEMGQRWVKDEIKDMRLESKNKP